MTGVRQFSSFEELPKETRELFEKAGEDNFFSSLPWFRVFVDHALDAGDLVKIYSTLQLAESDGTLRARCWQPFTVLRDQLSLDPESFLLFQTTIARCSVQWVTKRIARRQRALWQKQLLKILRPGTRWN